MRKKTLSKLSLHHWSCWCFYIHFLSASDFSQRLKLTQGHVHCVSSSIHRNGHNVITINYYFKLLPIEVQMISCECTDVSYRRSWWETMQTYIALPWTKLSGKLQHCTLGIHISLAYIFHINWPEVAVLNI